jgi:hypothetical protein
LQHREFLPVKASTKSIYLANGRIPLHKQPATAA